jgi:hypothetical protein
LKKENELIRQQLSDKGTKEVAQIVQSWSSSNEAFSKAILAIKECL